MFRRSFLALTVAVFVVSVVSAQSPAPTFRWKAGQTLDYRVEQTTSTTDTAEKQSVTVATSMKLHKRWQVSAVDDRGTATLQLTLLLLRMETRRPDGRTDVFDSQKLDPATADLNKEMLQYIGKPIAELRLDATGQLVEVTKSTFGPASRFQSELPFRLALPAVAPAAGQAWDRPYTIKLEPPHGAGETYNAVQRYTCKSASDSALVVDVTTTVKDLPDAPADRIPLVPFQPKGTITFDPVHGRVKKIELTSGAELKDHRGDGSRYQHTSTYVEELIEK